MIQEKIARGDLLFHSSHGLCRVDELMKENHAGKEVLCYSLVPKVATRAKARFIIEGASLRTSGFHPLISTKEANKILDYLAAGKAEAAPPGRDAKSGHGLVQEHHAWSLAKEILFFCSQDLEAKNKSKRQALERSIKGLVGEFSFVFKITSKEAADKIQKCLRGIAKTNPVILGILDQAGTN